VVDEVDARALRVEVVERLREHVVDEVADGAGRLHPGRSGADDHDVERAVGDACRVVVRGLEDLDQPGAQPRGVVHGVQREGVLLGARRVEEVRARAGRHHEVIAGERLTVSRRHRAGRRIDRGDGELLDHDGRVAVEDPAQRPGDVGHRQLGRGHLVQQRLELVVVVAVEQRDRHVVLGELPGAADAGEATPDDDHRRSGAVVAAHRSPQQVTSACLRSAQSAITWPSSMIGAHGSTPRGLLNRFHQPCPAADIMRSG
jgi:hypothetical protein